MNMRMVYSKLGMYSSTAQNPVSTDAVEGISEIRLNHGMVGCEVLVNSTGVDSCLNHSMDTKAKLIGGPATGGWSERYRRRRTRRHIFANYNQQ